MAAPRIAGRGRTGGRARHSRDLLLRRFELVCSPMARASGRRRTLRLPLEGAAAPVEAREQAGRALRILAAFSLPVAANPLNLRRERYGLQRLVRELNQTRGAAVELRVVQYGATRETLQEALEEDAGWDIIHLSGHGERGELLLEDDRGAATPSTRTSGAACSTRRGPTSSC